MTAPRRRQALAETLARLKAGGIADPGRDARLLLDNAREAMPEGGVISVRGQRSR